GDGRVRGSDALLRLPSAHPTGARRLIDPESLQYELNRKVRHVPKLHIGTGAVPDGLERSVYDLVAPQLIVLQAGRFHCQVRLHERAAHVIDVRDGVANTPCLSA